MGFLELVHCGYTKEASRAEGAAEATPWEGPPNGAAAARKKRPRHRPGVVQWRPLLGAISENAVLHVGDGAGEGEKRAVARAAAPEKNKKATVSLANAVAKARSWRSSSRQFAAQQTAIPALASAPFLF